MQLVTLSSDYSNFDFSSVPEVKEVFASLVNGSIGINLRCSEGDERKVFNSLPAWIHSELRVTQGHCNVFMYPKRK